MYVPTFVYEKDKYDRNDTCDPCLIFYNRIGGDGGYVSRLKHTCYSTLHHNHLTSLAQVLVRYSSST